MTYYGINYNQIRDSRNKPIKYVIYVGPHKIEKQ